MDDTLQGNAEQELKVELDALRFEIDNAKANWRDFRNRHFNRVVENAVVHCLEVATDNAEGAIVVANSKLLNSLYILTRALLENLILVRWLVLDEQNAQAFVGHTKHEMKRIAINTLKNRYGRARDKITGEDKSKELLESEWAKGVQKLPSLAEMARASKMHRVYVQYYGVLSLKAHGRAYDFSLGEDLDAEIVSVVAMAAVFTECINIVAKNWILHRRLTAMGTIYDALYPQSATGS